MFLIGVSVCTHTRQVEHQRCSRTGRVKKNLKILRKNTIFNEHPVYFETEIKLCVHIKNVFFEILRYSLCSFQKIQIETVDKRFKKQSAYFYWLKAKNIRIEVSVR